MEPEGIKRDLFLNVTIKSRKKTPFQVKELIDLRKNLLLNKNVTRFKQRPVVLDGLCNKTNEINSKKKQERRLKLAASNSVSKLRETGEITPIKLLSKSPSFATRSIGLSNKMSERTAAFTYIRVKKSMNSLMSNSKVSNFDDN